MKWASIKAFAMHLFENSAPCPTPITFPCFFFIYLMEMQYISKDPNHIWEIWTLKDKYVMPGALGW
jgi:hypothetical protein